MRVSCLATGAACLCVGCLCVARRPSVVRRAPVSRAPERGDTWPGSPPGGGRHLSEPQWNGASWPPPPPVIRAGAAIFAGPASVSCAAICLGAGLGATGDSKPESCKKTPSQPQCKSNTTAGCCYLARVCLRRPNWSIWSASLAGCLLLLLLFRASGGQRAAGSRRPHDSIRSPVASCSSGVSRQSTRRAGLQPAAAPDHGADDDPNEPAAHLALQQARAGCIAAGPLRASVAGRAVAGGGGGKARRRPGTSHVQSAGDRRPASDRAAI